MARMEMDYRHFTLVPLVLKKIDINVRGLFFLYELRLYLR